MPVISRMNGFMQVFLLIATSFAVFAAAGEGGLEPSFYEILGVSKTEDSNAIKRAFKKLAVTMHPDKNPDDPQAQDKFLKLKKAYEVLKDPESRRTYDLYGEEGLNDSEGHGGHNSWSSFHDSFGLYDSDPEITTLRGVDFELLIHGSGSNWFVNFYSPACSHCHLMADEWRKVGQRFEGVVKIGAVNCQEDWVLCRQEGIQSYPTIMFYPNAEKYYGGRTAIDLEHYLLRKISAEVVEFENVQSVMEVLNDTVRGEMPWVLVICNGQDDPECPDWQSRTKLAVIMEDLASVGLVDCSLDEVSCGNLSLNSGTYFVPAGSLDIGSDNYISSLNYHEIASTILEKLPDAQILDEPAFDVIQEKLKQDIGYDWLIKFTFTTKEVKEDFAALQYRRLPALLPRFQLGRVDCTVSKQLCQRFHIVKGPGFVVFKRGGAHEVYVGGASVSEIVTFARASVMARTLRTLNPSTFPSVIEDGSPWVIDFHAPWCPPCRKLAPEFRKASQIIGGSINFATLDCSAYRALCLSQNVRSYPTIVFYNNSQPFVYNGHHGAKEIAEFVEDILRPPVISLDQYNFEQLVGQRSSEEMWLVDFYASWCGPCLQMEPQWRRLARKLRPLTNIRVASVDCVKEEYLCRLQQVHSYPSIRLYPSGQRGSSHYVQFQGFQRDAVTLRNWALQYLPSSVYSLTEQNFRDAVLKSNSPWLVDFYAPWCGPCQAFAPEFEIIAKKLEGRIRLAKLNCDVYPNACQFASVRAYPSVRFYRGKTGWADQDPAGLNSASLTADEIVAWVEALVSPPTTIHPQSHHDEL